MAEQLRFFGWQRSTIFDFASGTLERGRLQATLSLTARDREIATDDASRNIEFLIAGPLDSAGLLPAAIVGMMPPPGTVSAEATKYVFVELATADLPWRYTPQKHSDLHLRPWIVLIVGTPEEIEIRPPTGGDNGLDRLSTAAIKSTVTLDHPLNNSARWAHVQQTKGTNGRIITRILSPRVLEAETSYVAALVPAFDENGGLAWTPGQDTTRPCYHSWEFRTGEAGDFTSLARALYPIKAGPDLGRAPVTYPRVPAAEGLWVRGALAPINGIDARIEDEVAADVIELLQTRDAVSLPSEPRFWWPIVTVPFYGAPWAPVPTDLSWGATVNLDPRYRGIAGLGAWTGIELQEQIVDAAIAQAGSLGNAEQRIRQLVLGLTAAQSLWKQRLPTDPYQRLFLFGPTLRRLMTPSGPALRRISGDGRPLPGRLFSSAARRILRPGPARTALAANDATSPKNILELANICAPPPDKRPTGLPHADAASDEVGLPILEDELCANPISKAALEILVNLPGFEGDAELDDIGGLCQTVIAPPPDRTCDEITDLEALIESITAAIDPTVDEPLVKRRVLGGIQGLDEQAMAPTEICVGLDLPVWTFLRDGAPDWLLPGVNTLQEHQVVALQSNQSFIDAFLIGLSGQTVGELRWRNMPIRTGCTPMRMFWGQVNNTEDRRRRDIREIGFWDLTCDGEPNEVPLGHPQHQPCADEGGEPSANDPDLVVVFRSDLFRRYPRTVVYAAPAPMLGDEPNWESVEPFAPGTEILPTFQGSIGEDITFFRFDLNPIEAQQWWIVLEEPPPGYSFDNKKDVTGALNGAQFAHDSFHNPVRVLIRGASIIPES